MNRFAFDTMIAGKRSHVVLALLPWSDVTTMAIVPEAMRPTRLPTYLASNVYNSVETIDGELGTTRRTEMLDNDPAAKAAILAKRYEVYQELRGAGRIYAQCPHCRRGEVEMSLLGLAGTLGVMPPEMFAGEGHEYFRSTVSDDTEGPPARPEKFAYASQIRFVLPTKLAGLPRASFEGGVIGRASTYRAQPAWERWETDGMHAPLEQCWRHSKQPQFRTTIWLIAAMRELVPPGEATVEAFEQLPAVDVYFLDAIYRLVFDTDVPEHAMTRPCPECGGAVMPVAPMIYEHSAP